jgi:2-methylcitrate dehydratase
MEAEECRRYSEDYLDPQKRSIANSVQVFFEDGTQTEEVEVEFPLGHRRRRAESLPRLFAKLRENLSTALPEDRVPAVVALLQDRQRLEGMGVSDLVDLFPAPGNGGTEFRGVEGAAPRT